MKTKIACLLASSILLGAIAVGQDQPTPKASKAGAFPSCTDSLPTVAVPDGPHGLFAIFFPGAVRINARVNQYLLHNPVVCGANFYLVWNEIDRGPSTNPRYDFSHVEHEMEPWVKAGKQVNLIVWATHYGGGQRATPDHVFRKVQSVRCENAGEVLEAVTFDRAQRSIAIEDFKN